MPGRIFDGLKVIDCASYIAGPAAATVMSDFGAEVIKIEPLGAGDPYRHALLRPPEKGMHPNWVMDARNKKSLAIDLASDAGRAVLYRMVADADVFITNYPFPVRRKLRVRAEDLAPLNPRLIYASFSGYGETGAEADKPGFDSTVWWGRSGMMDLVRAGPDADPARSLPGMGDHPSAMGMYGAIVTALYQRERTGKGGAVGSSLLANGLWANACTVQAALCGDTIAIQPPRHLAAGPTRNNYRCRDGRWIILTVVPTEDRWLRFATHVGDGALLTDPRFATGKDRDANAPAMIAELDRIFATKDFAEWKHILEANGLVFGYVARIEDVPTDRQAIDTGVLVPFADDDLLTVSSPFWIEGQGKVTPRRAPTVGQHNEQVLREAGYAAEEIAALRAAGVIG
jgi:formyl-CoA transferase